MIAVIHYKDMLDVETGLFTVAVFQDVAWARKGLNALKQIGLAPESLTIIAKDSPDAAALIEQTLGSAGERIEKRVERIRHRLPHLGLAGTGENPYAGLNFDLQIAWADDADTRPDSPPRIQVGRYSANQSWTRVRARYRHRGH